MCVCGCVCVGVCGCVWVWVWVCVCVCERGCTHIHVRGQAAVVMIVSSKQFKPSFTTANDVVMETLVVKCHTCGHS